MIFVLGADPAVCDSMSSSLEGDDQKTVLFALLGIARVEAACFAASFVTSLYALLNAGILNFHVYSILPSRLPHSIPLFQTRGRSYLGNATLFLTAAYTHAHHSGFVGPAPAYAAVAKPEVFHGLLIGDCIIGTIGLLGFFTSSGSKVKKS